MKILNNPSRTVHDGRSITGSRTKNARGSNLEQTMDLENGPEYDQKEHGSMRSTRAMLVDENIEDHNSQLTDIQVTPSDFLSKIGISRAVHHHIEISLLTSQELTKLDSFMGKNYDIEDSLQIMS